MKAQRPIIADDDHQVIPFRPRGARRGLDAGNSRASVGQRSGTLGDRDSEPDDFRHRMWANLAAFAFTAILTAVGIWLASNIADLRKGRRIAC